MRESFYSIFFCRIVVIFIVIVNQFLLFAPKSKQSVLRVFQAELIVGDQSGVIHIWDLKTDHNEQLIPEPEVSVNSVHIDPDASYMAAVNSSVSPLTVSK